MVKCFDQYHFEVNISFFPLKGGKSIHEAARQGDLDTVRHLIDEGTDVNSRDDEGVSIRTWIDYVLLN